jgi:hypothetical protein
VNCCVRGRCKSLLRYLAANLRSSLQAPCVGCQQAAVVAACVHELKVQLQLPLLLAVGVPGIPHARTLASSELVHAAAGTSKQQGTDIAYQLHRHVYYRFMHSATCRLTSSMQSLHITLEEGCNAAPPATNICCFCSVFSLNCCTATPNLRS